VRQHRRHQPVFAAAAGAIRRLHPQVRVDVEEQVSGAVASTLREGRADVGVFVQGPDTAGLDVQDFRRDELVLVLPAGHRLLGKAPLAFVDTLDEEWISLTAGAAMLAKAATGGAGGQPAAAPAHAGAQL
jgi:DNA-binding transcriptional LysR family regulator